VQEPVRLHSAEQAPGAERAAVTKLVARFEPVPKRLLPDARALPVSSLPLAPASAHRPVVAPSEAARLHLYLWFRPSPTATASNSVNPVRVANMKRQKDLRQP